MNYSEDPRYANSIEGVEPDERVVFEVHKHLFGLITMYITAVGGLVVLVVLAAFLLPTISSFDHDGRLIQGLEAIGVVASMSLLISLLVATYVYRQNRLIITDKHVTQVMQRGIFRRQVSELSLSNVEDVTSDQEGFLPMLFNFGELRIETAGEQSNFHFSYCPRPGYFGKLILEARQRYADGLKEEN